MSTQILEKLFGGSARLKIMRLFLFNPDKNFEKSEIIKKTQISDKEASNELKRLEKIGFIKKGYKLNQSFEYNNHLKGLLLDPKTINDKHNLTIRFSKFCRPKLIVASGIFISTEDSRLDILVVGDAIKEKQIPNIFSDLESEIGKEIKYSVFSTDEFKYRLGFGDRLIRDLLDYPHNILLDKIGLN